MTSINYARRRARGGQKKLPANPAQWACEHNGLDLREDLNLNLSVPLPHERAYALLSNVHVLPHGDVPAADLYLEHFRGDGLRRWSGLAIREDDGTEFVVFNDAHRITRVRATLMEEFFHIRLDHQRSQIRLLSGDEGGRTYLSGIEQEAYGSGAAALVPYAALRQMVSDGLSSAAIATVFQVSTSLIEYRLKVTKLYRSAHRRRS